MRAEISSIKSGQGKEYPIAFWLRRANHFKIFGPIIDAQKRRGFESLLLMPASDLKSAQDKPLAYSVDAIRVADNQELFLAARDQTRWIVSIGLRLPLAYEGGFEQLRRSGVKFASIDHIQESLLQVLEDGPGILDGWDFAATGSEEGIEALCHEIEAHKPPFAWSRARWEETKRVREVFRAVGYPHLDPLVGMDQAACRAKWNLPDAGRIVLLAPAAHPALLDPWWWRAYTTRHPLWRRVCWLKASRWSRARDDRHIDEKVGLMPYRDILQAFRRWADRHGAFVVAKVRAKTPHVHFLNGVADRMIGDEAFHPFTTLELCRAADVYIGLASGMAIEATAAGLPQIHVLAYPPEAYEVPAFLPLRRRFYLDRPGLWNGLGTSFFPTYTATGSRKLAEWAATASWPREGPAPAALERMAGPPGGRASERFLDLLNSP